MTVYYSKIKHANKQNAALKAPTDVNEILRRMGCSELPIIVDAPERVSFATKLKGDLMAYRIWKGALSKLGEGDVLILQFPARSARSFLLGRALRRFQGRGGKVVLLLHDLECIRLSNTEGRALLTRIRMRMEEADILKSADVVIAHNEAMKGVLIERFGLGEERVVSLGIFDYLVDDDPAPFADAEADGPIVVAGNLMREKAGYAYRLPVGLPFRLYGMGYDGDSEGVEYMGSFPPGELPGALSGSFGLVWDGASVDTAAGVYGEYLRVNNPHKTSLYLASGLPVIVWDQAALAPFVREHGVGIAVSGLGAIGAALHGLTNDEYEDMHARAVALARRLRAGEFTRAAVEESLQKIGLEADAIV